MKPCLATTGCVTCPVSSVGPAAHLPSMAVRSRKVTASVSGVGTRMEAKEAEAGMGGAAAASCAQGTQAAAAVS